MLMFIRSMNSTIALENLIAIFQTIAVIVEFVSYYLGESLKIIKLFFVL